MELGLGACTAGDPHSALAGRSALLEGGNAVDAAVAAGLMASFTLPTLTGLGGAGLMTIRMGDEVVVCDFFANIPGIGLTRERAEPEVLEVPFEDVVETFLMGPSTVAVPGVVAGLWAVHRRYGKLPLKHLIQVVVQAARQGVRVQNGQYRGFALLQAVLRRTPETWELCGDENGLYPLGHRFKNGRLADTLELLAAEGPRAFYEGELARDIVEAAHGHVTPEDLAAYEPVWRKPLAATYRGHRVYVPGMPSLSGAMTLVSLGELEKGPPLPPRRDAAEWGRMIDALRKGESLRTPEYEEQMFRAGYLEGVVAACRAGNTVHCSTVDRMGNAVSYTSTMGETAGLTAKGRGFALNNFMGEPDILPRGKAFEVGRRMMTSMCPTVVRRKDGRWLALGSAGSARIRSATVQVLVNALDGGASLQQAIQQPRIHVQGDRLYVEGYGRTPDEVRAFEPYGLEVVATWAAGFFFGGAQAAGQSERGFDLGFDDVRRGSAGYLA